MNNKGFAITGILYGVLLLFLMVLISLLSVLVFRLNRFTTLVDEVSSDMENKNLVEINETIDTTKYYQTPYRGKYTFTINGTTTKCYAYLPKNIALKTDSNKMYYIEPTLVGDKYEIDVNTTGTELTLIGCTNSDINNFTVTNIDTSTNS